jgi:hypothetical protein
MARPSCSRFPALVTSVLKVFVLQNTCRKQAGHPISCRPAAIDSWVGKLAPDKETEVIVVFIKRR